MVLLSPILLSTIYPLFWGTDATKKCIPLKPVNNEQNSGPWNYDDPNGQWGSVNSQCNGLSQSGLALNTFSALKVPIEPLKFHNYDVPLTTPVVIINNGKTVGLNVNKTMNGQAPAITGGILRDKYEVVNIHFHWGNATNKGSEHAINGNRFDIEMHIVHKNVKYPTVAEAIRYKDGLAVLGFMLDIAPKVCGLTGLDKIYDALGLICTAGSQAVLDGDLAVQQLISKVNISNFLTYPGSLTTPPCSQAVTWHVFPDSQRITPQNANKFFNLLTADNKPLINNFRPLQSLNRRPVINRGCVTH